MVETLIPVPTADPSADGNASDHAKRRAANKVKLTRACIEELPYPDRGQSITWDAVQKGLSVLVSQSTKTFRATFHIDHKEGHPEAGKQITVAIGRVGEMTLEAARKKVGTFRGLANEGKDPRNPKPNKLTFEEAVGQFVDGYCKANQRTWDQTQRILKVNCAPLLDRLIETITRHELRALTRKFASDGHPYKASITQAYLKKMLRWLVNEGLVKVNVLADAENDYGRRSRDRVYSDDEIRSIWRAADKLEVVEGAYIKLLLLLAPRKTALACMRRSHLDDPENPTLWTTPFELTKSRKRMRDPKKRRAYLTPLPPLAQRILKGLPKPTTNDDPDPLVFPGLQISFTTAGQPQLNSSHLIDRLTQSGAPHLVPHSLRHTAATWLEDQGHSEWERGLVLNHAGSSVTADYSHGFAGNLKLELLMKWADHVESLVQPEGAVLLR
jgi:integrase